MRKVTLCFLLVLAVSWVCYGQAPTKQKPTFPRVVATFQLVNQRGLIPPTVIFTAPNHWGTYQVSSAMVQTVGGGDVDGLWIEQLQWTDDSGTNTHQGAELNSFPTFSQSNVLVARMKPRTQMKLSTISDHGVGGKYNVWIVVTQLM